MTDEVKKMGRPKAQNRVSDFPIYTFAPDAETYEWMKKAAEDMGVPLGTWARIELGKVARQWARQQGLADNKP